MEYLGFRATCKDTHENWPVAETWGHQGGILQDNEGKLERVEDATTKCGEKALKTLSDLVENHAPCLQEKYGSDYWVTLTVLALTDSKVEEALKACLPEAFCKQREEAREAKQTEVVPEKKEEVEIVPVDDNTTRGSLSVCARIEDFQSHLVILNRREDKPHTQLSKLPIQIGDTALFPRWCHTHSYERGVQIDKVWVGLFCKEESQAIDARCHLNLRCGTTQIWNLNTTHRYEPGKGWGSTLLYAEFKANVAKAVETHPGQPVVFNYTIEKLAPLGS